MARPEYAEGTRVDGNRVPADFAGAIVTHTNESQRHTMSGADYALKAAGTDKIDPTILLNKNAIT